MTEETRARAKSSPAATRNGSRHSRTKGSRALRIGGLVGLESNGKGFASHRITAKFDRFDKTMDATMSTNNQSLEVMAMSFFDAARDATTVITALAAIWGGVFAFLNWRRTKTADLPYAWLEGVKPDENGLVRTNLSVDNRGAADVLVTRIVLDVGCFAGDFERNTGGEWLPGPKTGQREKPLSLHVPSRKTRGTEITFYLDDHESPVFVRLDEQDGRFHAVLTATRR